MSVKTNHSRAENLQSVDPVWAAVQEDAEAIVGAEPAMASFVHETVLAHDRLEDVIVHRIAARLCRRVAKAYADGRIPLPK